MYKRQSLRDGLRLIRANLLDASEADIDVLLTRISDDIPINNVVFVSVTGGAYGSSSLAIVYLTSDKYGAALTFGYDSEVQRHVLYNGVWKLG